MRHSTLAHPSTEELASPDGAVRTLPVQALTDLMYCARLPYWTLVVMARLAEPPMSREGRRLFERTKQRADVDLIQRALGRQDVLSLAWDVRLRAQGWVGQVDLVLTLRDGALLLVECRRTWRAHSRASHVALATYAWMLQSQGRAVAGAWIWWLDEDRWQEVTLDADLEHTAQRLRALLTRWMAKPTFPDVSDTRAGLERRELCDLCPCDNLCMDQLREAHADDVMDRMIVSARRAKRQRGSAELVFF